MSSLVERFGGAAANGGPGRGAEERRLMLILLDPTQGEAVRAKVLLELGRPCFSSLAPILLKTGESESSGLVSWQTFAAIGAMRSRRATRPLLNLLRTIKDVPKRHGIVAALAALYDRRARTALARVLRDQFEQLATRITAADGLALFAPDPVAVAALAAALEDRLPRIRFAALRALTLCPAALVGPLVSPLLNDFAVVGPEGTVASCAEATLESLRETVRKRTAGRPLSAKSRRAARRRFEVAS